MFLFDFNTLSSTGILNIGAGNSAGHGFKFQHPAFVPTGFVSVNIFKKSIKLMFLFEFNTLSCSSILHIGARNSAVHGFNFRHPAFVPIGCVSI